MASPAEQQPAAKPDALKRARNNLSQRLNGLKGHLTRIQKDFPACDLVCVAFSTGKRIPVEYMSGPVLQTLIPTLLPLIKEKFHQKRNELLHITPQAPCSADDALAVRSFLSFAQTCGHLTNFDTHKLLMVLDGTIDKLGGVATCISTRRLPTCSYQSAFPGAETAAGIRPKLEKKKASKNAPTLAIRGSSASECGRRGWAGGARAASGGRCALPHLDCPLLYRCTRRTYLYCGGGRGGD